MGFNLQSFRADLQALASKPPPRFVIFTSNWCPDCIRGVPPAQEAFTAANISNVLVVDVGTRDEWKNRETLHPLKSDPELQINGIPTIITVTDDGRPGPQRLGSELESASSAEEARRRVDDFIAKHS